jgi:REP element-mobilizing transposase RayT
LVEGKRAWDARANLSDQQKGFRGWNERGYLPHRDSPGLTQFITYHLADAFPTELLGEWEALLKIEENRERRKKLEEYLDKGRGKGWLRQSQVADLCDAKIRAFDGVDYELKAWCLMPNHVHVLVTVTSVPMAEFVKEWKGGSAVECNKLLRCRGAFWAEDYWDTYMRDEEQERRCVRYIENNPVKARLVATAKDWRWSSARFRDQYGKLKLPRGC